MISPTTKYMKIAPMNERWMTVIDLNACDNTDGGVDCID
jgi:hypothetical protein